MLYFISSLLVEALVGMDFGADVGWRIGGQLDRLGGLAFWHFHQAPPSPSSDIRSPNSPARSPAVALAYGSAPCYREGFTRASSHWKTLAACHWFRPKDLDRQEGLRNSLASE
jgi:hypothetical protein